MEKSMEDVRSERKRLIIVDFYRIIFAIIVAIYHFAHFGFTVNSIYSIMLFFFVISGFSLTYTNLEKPILEDKTKLKNFYIKRFATIIPLYILIELFALFTSGENILTRIELLPLRLFGVQTAFNKFDFFVGINWFNSCLIIAYLIYPFINYLIYHLNKKAKTIIFIALFILYIYINCICIHFEVDIYYNMFVRILEFIIGAFFADFIFNNNIFLIKKGIIKNIICILISILAFVSLLFNYGTNYDVVFKVVFTMILIFSSALVRFENMTSKNILYKCTIYLSSISFEIFMLQDAMLNPIWKPLWNQIGSNSLIILVNFIILFALSILIHHIFTKPIKRYIFKKYLQ